MDWTTFWQLCILILLGGVVLLLVGAIVVTMIEAKNK